jgi:uncharacterized protein YdaU (DUF1376 family)
VNGLPYYKAYPRDFIEGTIGMGFELKAAYRLVLDLIYMQGGNLPDDARYISGLLGCTVKRWNLLRAELIALDKLYVSGDFLRNFRADKETETLAKFSQNQREKAAKPRKNNSLGEATAKPARVNTDTDADIREEDTYVSSVVSRSKPSDDCLAHFNAVAARVGWPQVQKITPARRAALSQRIADVGSEDAWREAIDRAARSPHLTGQNNRGWAADFDWLNKPANFTKLMEGNYDPRTANPQPKQPANGRSDRADPAIEQIARLTGLSEASGGGGRGVGGFGEETGSLWMGARPQ